MNRKQFDESRVIHSLRKAISEYCSKRIFDIDPDEDRQAWDEAEQIVEDLGFAERFLKESFCGRRYEAALALSNLYPAGLDTLDVRCPFCGETSKAVQKDALRRTVFCWKCGQPMRANYDAMSAALRQRDHAQKGAGNE